MEKTNQLFAEAAALSEDEIQDEMACCEAEIELLQTARHCRFAAQVPWMRRLVNDLRAVRAEAVGDD